MSRARDRCRGAHAIGDPSCAGSAGSYCTCAWRSWLEFGRCHGTQRHARGAALHRCARARTTRRTWLQRRGSRLGSWKMRAS